jgi:tripartite-type tricarboxylate transporter receptor subunit TctC
LAVTTSAHPESLPEVPSVGEFLPGYEASGWFGIAVPKNTPADIVGKLNQEFNAALADRTIRTRLAELGVSGSPGSSDEFEQLIVADTRKWAEVIHSANIRAQ